MTAKKKATKKSKRPQFGLMNWPPSRGPMPAHMRAKLKYLIPEVEIEMVEWVEGNGKRYKKPATEIKRVPTTPAPKFPKQRPGVIDLKEFRAKQDAQRELRLSLNHHVETMATLSSPEQWNLVGGAGLHPSRRIHPFAESRGFHVRPQRRLRKTQKQPDMRRGVKAYASIETYLPTRAITVDLTYPLSKIARVTIKPYTRFSRDRKITGRT